VKNIAILFIGAALMLFSCNTNKEEMNPLLAEFNTPFGVPPFDQVTYEHYMPAFKKAMDMQNAEIDAIINNEEAPTFENTIAALDYSGARLDAVSNIFYNIKSANTSDEMQAIARELVPLRSAHSSNINLNADLFDRIKTVWDQRDALNLTEEQEMLLDKVYKRFIRSGASLSEEDRANMRKIDEELSMLSLQFGDNLLKETNNYQLVIENEEDLRGLPEGVVAAAAEAAKAADLDGKWVFTLHKPSWIPFLTYAEKRELREEIYKAMYNRGNRDNEFDNKEIINKTIKLRTERAKLLGYDSHAGFVLEERMAKTEQNVYDLLMKLWTPAVKMAKEEAAMMQDMIDSEGGGFQLASWDWWYYAEKVRQEKYELDDEKLREYFSLEDVTNGVLDVINKLYGITFERRDDIPVYHPDVIAYEL
jgi:peptidyl-dipeptidase Dcp